MFTFFIALGLIFSPIIGGTLNQTIGYRSTFDIMALFTIIIAIGYFFINVYPLISSKESKSDKDLKEPLLKWELIKIYS